MPSSTFDCHRHTDRSAGRRRSPVVIAAAALLLSACLGPVRAASLDTAAKFAILIDGESGSVLFEKNADELMAPASMSKLMTMVVVFEALKHGDLKLTDEFLITENAFKQGGSRMFAKLGSSVPLEDLIRGVIVQSGNDACVALAEGLSGTEQAFAEEMNLRAKEMGLKKSHFVNATGWPDPEHMVTARELAMIARHIIYKLSDFYHYYSEKEFTWNNIKQHNRNPLLSQDIGADGLKTGHTEDSGYGLVGSAVQDDRRLILVVNGMKSNKERSEEARKLLDWGFRSFKKYVAFEKNAEVGTARVWGGEESTVPLVPHDQVTLLLTRLDRKTLKAEIVYNGPLKAPIKEGDQVARLRVISDDQVINEVPLYAGTDVVQGGIIGRAFDTLKFMVIGG